MSDLKSSQARFSSVVYEISDILNHIDLDSSYDGFPKLLKVSIVSIQNLMVLVDLSNRIREARQA